MRSSRGERAAPRGARHAGLGLQLDGRWEAEAASQPAEWRRRRQRSGVDPPVPTRPEGPGLTPALALLRRRHLLPHGPRSGKVDAPGGPSRRAHLLPCAPAPPPPRPPIPYARAAQSPIGYPVYPRPLLHRYCGHWCPNESSAPRAAHSPSPITPPSPPWALLYAGCPPLLYAGCPPLLRRLSGAAAGDELLAEARGYVRVRALGMPAGMIFMVLQAWLG